MAIVRGLIADNPAASRAALSRLVCEKFDWRGHDGRLRAMRCRVVMLRMQEAGLIQLPQTHRRLYALQKDTWARDAAAYPNVIMDTPVQLLENLTIALVCATDRHLSRRWNANIAAYHYLGYQRTVGHQLRYVVRTGTTEIAMLGFASAAWMVAARDKRIGWTPEERLRNLPFIVNNTRFLILPWVRSPNLASWILAHVAKRLPEDWCRAYAIRPVMLETFVDATRYTGHCYRAANWTLAGITEGRGRHDRQHQNAEPQKQVWLMPLSKKAMQRLRA
jgi:hypothetical protein